MASFAIRKESSPAALSRSIAPCDNLVALGVPLLDAVRMATLLPARRLGLGGKKGVIAVGADADLVVLTPDLAACRSDDARRGAARRAIQFGAQRGTQPYLFSGIFNSSASR